MKKQEILNKLSIIDAIKTREENDKRLLAEESALRLELEKLEKKEGK